MNINRCHHQVMSFYVISIFLNILWLWMQSNLKNIRTCLKLSQTCVALLQYCLTEHQGWYKNISVLLKFSESIFLFSFHIKVQVIFFALAFLYIFQRILYNMCLPNFHLPSHVFAQFPPPHLLICMCFYFSMCMDLITCTLQRGHTFESTFFSECPMRLTNTQIRCTSSCNKSLELNFRKWENATFIMTIKSSKVLLHLECLYSKESWSLVSDRSFS